MDIPVETNMNRAFILSFTLSLAFTATLFSGTTQSSSQPADRLAIKNFRLLDQNGVSRELHRQKHLKALVLFVTGNGCPIARQTLPALKELRAEFASQGVEFWLLNSNAQDDRASVLKEAEEFGIDFPILVDAGQWVGASLGVNRTGEALVVSPSDWQIVYRGSVDDRLGYGTQKEGATHHPLADALRQVVAGQAVTTARSEFKGCAVTYAQRSPHEPETNV